MNNMDVNNIVPYKLFHINQSSMIKHIHIKIRNNLVFNDRYNSCEVIFSKKINIITKIKI